MKKIYTILVLTISFNMNAQMTDNSSGTSATGDYSVAMGVNSISSGFASTSSGQDTEASGTYSFAAGINTLATSQASFASGADTVSDAAESVAMGRATLSSGGQSFAMGYGSIASGGRSFAMGHNTAASGEASTAMGSDTTASGDYSTAMGVGTTASGAGSTAMGGFTTASGNGSTAIGNGTTASGYSSTAMGFFSKASDRSSLVIGEYNLLGSTVTNSATQFSADNTAFVIGNGANANNRADAFVVMFNGDATLAGNLSVNSDARLKSNIISLGSTMSKLLEIDGKSYIMKKDEKKEQKIGLLAQDIEKVFPELVSESNGIKSVNYQGLVPVLINALKEQDVKMKEQQMKIESLRDQEKRIDRLEKLIAQLD